VGLVGVTHDEQRVLVVCVEFKVLPKPAHEPECFDGRGAVRLPRLQSQARVPGVETFFKGTVTVMNTPRQSRTSKTLVRWDS
jgi:hypothetical protein